MSQFPYKAWVLMPSFKPVEVTVVGKSWTTYHETEKGKVYSVSELYPSKQSAIQAGRDQLEKQRADLLKRQERIDKRAAALDAAMSQ